MEIVRSQKNKSRTDVVVSTPTPTLYRSASDLEVSLEDFEPIALDRRRVLEGILDGLSRGKKKKPEEKEKLVNDLWKRFMSHYDASQVINIDNISHFALRAAHCRTKELRNWFLSMETDLFRFRFQAETPEAQRVIMEDFDLPYKAMSNAELEEVKDKFNEFLRLNGQPLLNSGAIFFKVLWSLNLVDVFHKSFFDYYHPNTLKDCVWQMRGWYFQEVPELVAVSRVFIHEGYAYVAMNQVVSLVVSYFRRYLSEALVLTNRQWTSTIKDREENRLTPIIEALSTSYLGPDFSQPKEFTEISIMDIDKVASSSFPLCMRHLFDKLREDHHLKFGGRMQLVLFLKGVGLQSDDALAFMKAEFYPKIGAEKFDQDYGYHIRHLYGKEGKRTDYTPYSCQKITKSTPGVKDHHGCPYRHFSEKNLRADLGKMGIRGHIAQDVIGKVRNRDYQSACALTFEAVHGSSCDAGINHPNQYFNDSQKILQSKVSIG